MTETTGTPAEPTIDENPDPGNAAGGTDAVVEDIAAPPVSRELPAHEQASHPDVPDELLEPEGPDREANIEDPSTEPSA